MQQFLLRFLDSLKNLYFVCLQFNKHNIVTDIEGNIRIYRLPWGRGTDHEMFLDRSISATQSVSRNSKGHMESVQPIKCMFFILIFNKCIYNYYMFCHRFSPSMILIKSTLKMFICLYVRFYLFLKLQFLLRFLDSLKNLYFVCLQFNKHNSYWYRGQYQDIQTAPGSWYRPWNRYFPCLRLGQYNFHWSVPWPLRSLYILILRIIEGVLKFLLMLI
jgi:hypothetical protein